MGIDPSKRYTATLDTSLGQIVIALDAVKAPKTVNNFVFLALNHYYDGVIFHRIINGFMCQGGDPTGTGTGGPGYKFEDELPKPREYQIGSVAMANAGAEHRTAASSSSCPDRRASGCRRSTACSARSSRASTCSTRCRTSRPAPTRQAGHPRRHQLGSSAARSADVRRWSASPQPE